MPCLPGQVAKTPPSPHPQLLLLHQCSQSHQAWWPSPLSRPPQLLSHAMNEWYTWPWTWERWPLSPGVSPASQPMDPQGRPAPPSRESPLLPCTISGCERGCPSGPKRAENMPPQERTPGEERNTLFCQHISQRRG